MLFTPALEAKLKRNLCLFTFLHAVMGDAATDMWLRVLACPIDGNWSISAGVRAARPVTKHARQLRCAAAATDTVIPSPSYAIPAVLLSVAGLSVAADNKVLAGITGILGVFLAIQASRVKFKFDSETLVRYLPGSTLPCFQSHSRPPSALQLGMRGTGPC